MATNDFIPSGNAEFDAWQINFVIKVNSFKAGWNWNTDATAEWTLLTGTSNLKQARWAAIWAKVSSKEFMHSDEVELKAARKSYESGDKNNPVDTSLRIFTKRYIANNKNVTLQQKKACGLTVPDTVLTPAGNPATRSAEPQLTLKKQAHLLHQIEVMCPGAKSKAKADGVKEIVMYMTVQAANLPTPALSVFQYVGDVKRGIYTSNFADTQEGMKAYYYIREKNSKGLLGNPSMVIGVIIS